MNARLVTQVLGAFLMAATATSAQAGSATWGFVTGVGNVHTGIFHFTMSSSHQNAPSCQGSYVPDRWAVNASTAAGQALMATVLTAFAQRKQVYINGLGSCQDLGDTESVGSLDVSYIIQP